MQWQLDTSPDTMLHVLPDRLSWVRPLGPGFLSPVYILNYGFFSKAIIAIGDDDKHDGSVSFQ